MKDNVPLWLTDFKEVLNKSLLWDLIEYKIRQLTMKYSKTKALERRSRLCEIEKKLKECQEILYANPTGDNSTELETITCEYNSLYDYITEGHAIRSRVN